MSTTAHVFAAHVCAVLLFATVAQVSGQDACSRWVPLSCSGYIADTTTALSSCKLENRTATQAINSFDTSLRPTSPTSSLTYCEQRAVYDFLVPSDVQNTTGTIVTLIGSMPSVSSTNPAHEAQIHVVTRTGVQYFLGSVVNGYNSVIGTQRQLNRPLTASLPSNVLTYPFNGILTCSNQVAYQPWRVPLAIQQLGVQRIRIYDPAGTIKVYSITVDLCDSYGANPGGAVDIDTNMGEHVTNMSLRIDPSVGVVTVADPNVISNWPLCAGACYGLQSSVTSRCVAYALNMSSRTCFLFENVASLQASNASAAAVGGTFYAGVLPPRTQRKAAAAFASSVTNGTAFPSRMLTRPDLYGGFTQSLMFFYRVEDRRSARFYLRGATKYAISVTQSSFFSSNFLVSYATQFDTGAGGRMAVCGSPPRHSIFGVPFANNNSILQCTDFGHCVPQSVGTLGNTLTGPLNILFQESPLTSSSCGNFARVTDEPIGALLLLSYDGTLHLGATYALASIIAATTTKAATLANLAALHFTSAVTPVRQYAYRTSVGGSTTSALFAYQVAGLTASSPTTPPKWFWFDSEQRTSATSVLCQVQTEHTYRAHIGLQGMPSGRYRCGLFASLMGIIHACNHDTSCAGVTAVAVNTTAEVPLCMISNATLERTDPLALNPNATLFLKEWSPDALQCVVPTYGAYGVEIRVAVGFLNGSVSVYADNSILVATCTLPPEPLGETACVTFLSCFIGNMPVGTTSVTVRATVGFPARRQCSETLLRALVSFDLRTVFPVPSSTCLTTVRPPSCSMLGNVSFPATNCTSATLSRIPIAVNGVGDACVSSSLSLPSSVARAVYITANFSTANSNAGTSAQYSVVARDGLQRRVVLGFIVAPSLASASPKVVHVGRSPEVGYTVCANVSEGFADAALQFVQLAVPNALLVNGITDISLRGANVSLLQVSSLAGNVAGCDIPFARNTSAASEELAFNFLSPSVFPTTGLVVLTLSTVDFMDCAIACAETPQCGIYTYITGNASCVLRNAAGRWRVSQSNDQSLIMSGSLARAPLTRFYGGVVAPQGFTGALLALGGFSQVVLFASDVLPDTSSVVLQFLGVTSYQIATAQSGFGGDGVIVSGSEGSGFVQACGNTFEPFLSSSDATDGECLTYRLCPAVGPVPASSAPISITARLNSGLVGSGVCGTPLLGLIGVQGSASLSSTASYYQVDMSSVGGVVTPGARSTGVVEVLNATVGGRPTQLVLRETGALSPFVLSQDGFQSAYCRIVTRTVFVAIALAGFEAGTSYACGAYPSLPDAVAACKADSSCAGFTVDSADVVRCFSRSGNHTAASTSFMKKITTSSCTFTVTAFSIISVSVLDMNLFRGSNNNVDILWNGVRVKKCGSSRPFSHGYSTNVAPQCASYVECFNDLLPGAGTLEVVFPSNSTTMCNVFQSAIVTIIPQARISQVIATNAAMVLPSVRTIKYSPQDLDFSLMQFGATRVAVHVKQDRFFSVGAVQTFALNVSIGGQQMGLCGGTVGFLEGPGLDSQCQTFYYCGIASQNQPVASAGLTGPITVRMMNQTLRVTSRCNARFDAIVLTDGMLLTAMPSRTSFRSLFVYDVTVSDFLSKYQSNAALALQRIQDNTTALMLAFPSIKSPATATVYRSRLFPVLPNVASVPSSYYAVVDDIRTPDEAKVLSEGKIACFVDRLMDETLENGCEIQLAPDQNKITVTVAQTNFNLIGRTMSVIVNDVVVGTCGGDNLFLGFQGLSGLCDNYFVCFDDWITPGALVRVVFSDLMVSTSNCVPAAAAFVEAKATVYIPPLTCPDPAFPFKCNVDRRCLSASQVCNDVADCSDRSDEGKCRNWRFAGSNLAFGSCAPSEILTVSREACVRAAVVAQTTVAMHYNASACVLFSCVDYSAPNISVVSTAGVSFETWIYTTDPSGFLYCTDALHCNNNGVVASTIPPCACTCLDQYTGDGCASQLDLSLIDAVVGVLAPGQAYNTSVMTYFTSALLGYLPTGSIVGVSGVQYVNVTVNETIVVEDDMTRSRHLRPLAAATMQVQVQKQQVGIYCVMTDYTGSGLSSFVINSLLEYDTRLAITQQVPGLETLTATSVVGPNGRMVCYKTSLSIEGTACTTVLDVNGTRTALVTVTGISFISPSQYVDVTLTDMSNTNATVRCSDKDFVQYRDSTISGVCSYRSVCAIAVPELHAVAFTIDFSPSVNPGNIICNGYQVVSTARLLGSIPKAASSTGGVMPTFDAKNNIGFTIVTGAFGALFLFCLGLLVSWYKLRKRFDRIKPLGPILGFFAFCFLFASLVGLAFYVGSEELSFTHMVVMEEYRDHNCDASMYSSIPTRVSYMHSQHPECQQLQSVGPAEGMTYARATLTSNASGVVSLWHGSETSCGDLDDSFVSVPLGVCIPESLVFPEKKTSDLSYMMLFAYPLLEGANRLRLMTSYNPILALTTTTTTRATTVGEQYSNVDGYRYFENGFLHVQTAMVPGATVDHFAILAKEEVPSSVTSASPEVVVFAATIVTESTALSDSTTHYVTSTPFVTSRNNVTNVGVTFNNFNSTNIDVLEAAGPYATVGSYNFLKIVDSGVNGGDAKLGFTVSFWIQAGRHTRGFVYAVVDGWLESKDYSSPIIERLFKSVESGSGFNRWFEVDWHCYHAVYVSEEAHILAFVMASPEKGVKTTVFDLAHLGLLRVFDGGWHYITLVVDNSVPTSPKSRLFVDGENRRDVGGWYQCNVEPTPGVVERPAGTQVHVINNRQEVVNDGGMLVLGALNARLFDFSVRPSLMTQEEIVREGAPGMELYSSIARIESLGLGVTTLLFALVSVFYAGRHMWNHFFGINVRDDENDSDDEFGIAGAVGPAQTSGRGELDDPEEAAKKMVSMSDVSIFDQSVPFYQFIQPVLLTVQIMALYMYAWEWPATYSEQFFGIFSIVSLDFQVSVPTTNPVTWPLIQFFVGGILFMLLLVFSMKDRASFNSIVLQFSELLRLRQRRANPFGVHGVAEVRVAKPTYKWVYHIADEKTVELSEDQEDKLLRCLQSMMARRMKTEANMRLYTPRLVDMGGKLGTGIIMYERVNGKVFISFRASDHTAEEDRDARKIVLTQTTIECIADNTVCPEHELRLLPDDLMQYTCIHSSNPYYRSMECPRRCVMYACPHEMCDYAVCEYCYNGGTVTAAVSGAIAALNQLKRRGFFAIFGMSLVELAAAIYLPVLKSAMMVIGCHEVYVCTFGDCWLKPSWSYILALLFAFTALVVVGGGYFLINAFVFYERHFTLRETLPHRPGKRPFFHFLPTLSHVKESDYDDFMQLDDTLLVTLYQPFRFRFQWFPIVLYVFRVVLPASVFITNSGGLPQLLAAVVLEAFLSLAIVAAAPYKSIWIELLSRLGSVHQLVLLGLMSLHRVYIRDNPGSVGYGEQMAVATIVYLGIVALLLIVIVIVPAVQRMLEARRRRKKEEANSHRDENYDIGVWGHHVSRGLQEIEAKKEQLSSNIRR